MRATRALTVAGAAIAGLAALLGAAPAATAGGYEDLKRCAALARSTDAEGSVKACTTAIAAKDLSKANRAIAYYNRGNAHRRLARHAAAESDYTKAIEIWPELDMAWNNRGSARAKLCRPDAALADIKKAMELNPEWVKHYQSALSRAGVDVGVVDGKMGPKTEAGLVALIRAQCKK
ncbi:MAG: hypothetical protein MRY74_00530 [Neomegalonema sp.]|nr:hypothetical protein [Neomegalonema sp.]